MTCGSCGAAVPEGARFCPSCGQATSVPSDERRVATVLFGDLVGFTTLSETADPEHVKNLVDACFGRLVAEIETFGGKVDKIVGDAIVALFGAPVAHEDDAERAVRAALRMQETLARHAAEGDVDVRMRIGVNTGEVLVGALRAGGDYTAMGDVVNTASRLQTAAQPGQVLVGPATFAATHGVIGYDELGLLQARGRDEPVPAWAATAPLLPPGYRPQRERAPLVGRDPELAMLKGAVDAAVAHGRAQLILLLGEAGVGKSRLAEEVAALAECDHEAIVLEGRCVPYGEANVWWPVAEALRQALSLSAEAPFSTASDHAFDVVARTLDLDPGDDEVARVVEGLLYLLGYEVPLRDIDPQRARDEATRSVLTLIEGYALDHPVVIVLSDLHWADDLVLEMIDDMLARLGRYPYVVVGTSRPGIEERWVPRHGRHNSAVLNLDPLDRSASEHLLSLLLEQEAGDDVRALLLDRSGGNPFFLEELVSLLDETGMVGGTPSADGGLRDLPDTLRGLVAARLDALPAKERQTLVNAAVWGRRGPVEALEKMLEKDALGEADAASAAADALHGLAAKEVLLVEGQRWSFHSELVRDVAYGTLTKSDRARKHAGIATHLEEHPGAAPDERVVDIVAYHFNVAAQLSVEMGDVAHLRPDIGEKALHWLMEAARRADRADLHQNAARLYGQAVDLATSLGQGDQMTGAVLGRAHALAELRDLGAARADVGRALSAAERSGDRTVLARALVVLGEIEWREGDHAAAVVTLDRAIDEFQELGDRQGLAKALRSRGMADLMVGAHDDAPESLQAALAASREVGDVRGEAWALQNLAWIAFVDGDPEEAERRLAEAIAKFEDIRDKGGLSWAYGLMAWIQFRLGDTAAADALVERVLPEARERGDQWGEGMMLILQSVMRLWSGRAREAHEIAAMALANFRRIGDVFGEVQALAPVGRSLIALGRVDEGFAVLEEMLAVHGTTADMRRLGLTVVAAAATHVGEPHRLPPELLDDDLSLVDASGLSDDERLVALGLCALQRGDVEGALTRLEKADGGARSHPYPQSALALALVAADRVDEAVAAAEWVVGSPQATYLDRTQALLAAALGHARRGDRPATLEALAGAQAEVAATDDQLTRALVCLAEAQARTRLGDDAGELSADAERALLRLGVTADGWKTAYSL
ncbi:MAG: AAA family ATPase [Acidimicrobiales bacterium]|nr:AAA family ATPase [Acidimicrobiales bacterium]